MYNIYYYPTPVTHLSLLSFAALFTLFITLCACHSVVKYHSEDRQNESSSAAAQARWTWAAILSFWWLSANQKKVRLGQEMHLEMELWRVADAAAAAACL